MNREIKFRAWHEELKDEETGMIIPAKMDYNMIFVKYYGMKSETKKMPEELNYTHLKSGILDINEALSKEKHLMQSTGLKDKNGVDCYEKDLLKDRQGRIFEVRYEDGGFHLFQLEDYKYPIRNILDVVVMEVIGNIFENKELLEK